MNAKQLIEQLGSEFFTVTFTKKNGDVRVMNCRKNVTKHLRGGASTTSHIDDLITVYDVKSNGYRNINATTVTEVKANGKRYQF